MSESLKSRLLNDPAVSLWLKQAIRQLERRDTVDALRDAELLARVLTEEYEATAGRSAAVRPTADGYDYGLQVYTNGGIILGGCGHPEEMREGGLACCNSYRFAGMRVEDAKRGNV